MFSVFATVATVFLENDLVLVFKLVFTSNIISMSANRADKAEFDSNVFLCHYGLL